MRQYESSVLRPFGSMLHGTAWMALIIGCFYVGSLAIRFSFGGQWRPTMIGEAALQPIFFVPSVIVLLIGLPLTWKAFAESRGSYTAAATELEIRSGLDWQEFKALRYVEITDIELSRGPLMGIAGTQDLKIYGGRFPHSLTTLYGIRDAEEVRRFLLDRRDSLRALIVEGDDSGTPLPNDLLSERLTRVLERLEKRL